MVFTIFRQIGLREIVDLEVSVWNERRSCQGCEWSLQALPLYEFTRPIVRLRLEFARLRSGCECW